MQFPKLNTLLVLYSLIASHPAIAVETSQIQIKINADMLSHKRIAYGTQWQVEGLSDWDDGEIVHLAMVAHQAMLQEHKRWLIVEGKHSKMSSKDRASAPSVTTTLVVDNTAYISTSARGNSGPFIYAQEQEVNRYRELLPDAPCAGAVATALNNCKIASEMGWGHQNGASCGEVWATQGFCSTGTTASLEGSRVVAIKSSKAKEDKTERLPEIVDPCVTWVNDVRKYKGAWGCRQFTEDLGLVVIPDSTTEVEKSVDDKDITNSVLLFRRA